MQPQNAPAVRRKVFTFHVKRRESFCRCARGASLARRAERGAIDFAFALRLRLGLGTQLFPFHVKRRKKARRGKPRRARANGADQPFLAWKSFMKATRASTDSAGQAL